MLRMSALYVHGRASTLTLSSRRPKTAALDKMTLSMKLNMYVTNNSGMMTRSIFFSTRRAMAASRPDCAMASILQRSRRGCVGSTSMCLVGEDPSPEDAFGFICMSLDRHPYLFLYLGRKVTLHCTARSADLTAVLDVEHRVAEEVAAGEKSGVSFRRRRDQSLVLSPPAPNFHGRHKPTT